jgi:hypothetical protein
MMGIRSLDPDERLALRQAGITVQDMRSIDENGVAHLLSVTLRPTYDPDPAQPDPAADNSRKRAAWSVSVSGQQGHSRDLAQSSRIL